MVLELLRRRVPQRPGRAGDVDQPVAGRGRGLKRLTGPQSNEPESDPLLGGAFIGDYIEGVLIKNRYYVHYNANYRQMRLLGFFEPLVRRSSR